MIGLLIIPMLICGYFYISTWPSEKIRISLYQGWSLYLRAASFGFLIITFLFISLAIILPWLGVWLGSVTGVQLLPNSNIFLLFANAIKNSNLLPETDVHSSSNSINIISISIISIIATWLFTMPIGLISNGKSVTTKSLSKKLGLEKIKSDSVEKVFLAKSPIEYQLLIIAKKAEEDLVYNKYISDVRKEAYKAIANGDIDRNDKAKMNEIFETLEYRELDYALITLENEKFYIGLPKILPEPDEEGIASTSILIIPVMSGYRDLYKSLNFTTEYDFNLSDAKNRDCISFPRDKILTVSGFSFTTYNRLRSSSKKIANETSSNGRS